MNENNICLECGKRDLTLTKKGQKENLKLHFLCSNCRDEGYIRNNANIGMHTKYKNFKDNNKSSKRISKISLQSIDVGGGSAEVAGGGHASAGGGGVGFDDMGCEKEGEETRDVVGFKFLGHGNIFGTHAENTKNVFFQMASQSDNYAYKLPPGKNAEIVGNTDGSKASLDMLKIKLREKELEIFKEEKNKIVFFLYLIHPENNTPNSEEKLSEILLVYDHKMPQPIMYHVMEMFKELMNTTKTKDERFTEFRDNLKTYEDEIKKWCPQFDPQFNTNIEYLFKRIKFIFESDKTQLPNKDHPENMDPSLLNTFGSKIILYLNGNFSQFNELNSIYVRSIFHKLRHRTVCGVLPRYNLEGNHEGDNEPYAGFSLILYNNSSLKTMWDDFCQTHGIDIEIAKEQEGAILRNGSPMYNFLKWCVQFSSHKDEYDHILELLSRNYNEENIENIITTDEMLNFINFIKEIINKYREKEVDVKFYCYMIVCGKFATELSEEDKEKLKNLENDETQKFGGGKTRRKTRRNKKTRRGRKTR